MPSEKDVKDVACWKKFIKFVQLVEYGSKEKLISLKC